MWCTSSILLLIASFSSSLVVFSALNLFICLRKCPIIWRFFQRILFAQITDYNLLVCPENNFEKSHKLYLRVYLKKESQYYFQFHTDFLRLTFGISVFARSEMVVLLLRLSATWNISPRLSSELCNFFQVVSRIILSIRISGLGRPYRNFFVDFE